MAGVKQYIVSIISVAIICNICVLISPANSVGRKIIKMLCSVLISIAIISPVIKIHVDDLTHYFTNVSVPGDILVSDAKNTARKELSAVIKEQVESYILDKAYSLGVDILVSVELDNQFPPQPQNVRIGGSVSPYHKRILIKYISKNLGIPEENQIWC